MPKNIHWTILACAAGVVLAGAILRYGYDNDIPGVSYAAGGYDQ